MAQDETSLSEILDTIRRRWRLILLVALSLTLGASLYAERQPLQYEASTIVAVIPRGDTSADHVRVSAPRYASYITAAATTAKVAPRIGEDPGDLQDRVKAAIVPDTGNITITVRHPDPRRAMEAANALARQLQLASTSDEQVAVRSVAPAVLPTRPAGPGRRLIEVTVLVVGLLLGVGLAALLDAARRRPAVSDTPGRPLAAGPLQGGGLGPTGPPWALPGLRGPTSGSGRHERGGVPVVSDLPWSRTLRTSVADALADPPIDKAVTELTANLTYALGGTLGGTVVVTSPNLHQVRTTVARLLAAALQRAGTRVLRVDGHEDHSDILRARKDQGENHPDASPEQGGYDESGLNWVKDLWVSKDGTRALPTAHGAVAVALIEGREAEILSEARKLFDVTIVDAPPMLEEDDDARASVTRTLLPLSDAVLCVISPESTVASLYRSLDELRGAPGPFVGVVLNQVRKASGGSSKVRRLRSRPSVGDAREQ